MKLHGALFLLGLLAAGYTSTMDHASQIDTQNQSSLAVIPLELLPRILHFKNTWHMVRSTLALQQACKLWNNILNTVQKKNMVSVWINESNQFDENRQLGVALQALPQRMRWLQSDSEYTRSLVKHASAPELYLLAGANINHTDEYDDSPLMHAVSGINADDCSILYIKLLLDMGATVNHKNQDGDTALHWAVRDSAVHCVELLLQYDAHTDIKNNKQQTPIDILTQLRPALLKNIVLKRERILKLLNREITPQESIKEPIFEEDQKSTALDALNQLLDVVVEHPSNDEDLF